MFKSEQKQSRMFFISGVSVSLFRIQTFNHLCLKSLKLFVSSSSSSSSFLFFSFSFFPFAVGEKWTLELWFSFFFFLFLYSLISNLICCTGNCKRLLSLMISEFHKAHKSFLTKILQLVLMSFFLLCLCEVWFTYVLCSGVIRKVKPNRKKLNSS